MAGRTVRYQGGSIVPFIIIAVIITAALGIGLYVLRQRSEQARSSSTTSQNIPPELPGAPTEEKKDATKNATDTETFPSSSKKDTTSTDNKAQTKDKTPESATNSGSRNESTTSSPATAALPETGPEQLLVIPVLAVVAYVAVAYAGSSRTLARLR
jgi:cobalamin biosynthesis Mg chelatase CobN